MLVCKTFVFFWTWFRRPTAEALRLLPFSVCAEICQTTEVILVTGRPTKVQNWLENLPFWWTNSYKRLL